MQGPSTLITDPKTGKDRTFTFDYSFWSHDGFTEEADGLLVPSGTQYDDQEKVYNQLGKEVLDNAWDGYHCCLFAYGQTGSGKSYSMIGYGANKGIVPKAMNEVFERMKATTTKDKWYEVSVSMLEIYNECVQDLLADPDKRPSKGLNIRQSKVRGVYVQNLSQHPVPSFEAIEKIMEEGNKNRSIGSTEMNKTSSRAHTIITLSFKQFEIIDGKTTERFSNINLVDLAGSERAKSTKATKERLKEGCNINLSLTVLGQVINVLAEKSMGNKKNAVVPYRESALTRILSNALGGNSKTIMICAISPAELNYDESLNTLKYAERAKKVKNVAVVNESAQDKMIRELREENDKLKKLLMAATQGGAIDMNDPDFLARLGAFGIESKPGTNNPEEEIKEKLEDNEKEVKNMEISWKDKLEEEKKWENEREVQDKTLPHLTNLNEDPQLSGMLYYNLLESPIHVGRKTGNPKPTITIGGIGILPNHCVFEMEPKELPKEEAKEESQEEEKEPDESEGNAESPETPETPSEEKVLPKFYLRPCAEEACDSIFVNGENLNEEGVLLNHNDRIIFGNNTVFLFKYPELHKQLTGEDVVSKASSLEEEKIPEEEKGDSKEIDWEFVLNEKMSKADKIRKEEQEREEKAKMEEHQKKVAAEKKHMEDEMKKKQEEMEDKMRELEKQMLVAEEEKRQQYEKELEDAERLMIEKIEAMEKERIEREKQQQKELEDQEVIIKERQKENETLETKLSQLMPLINEANLWAKEFNKNVIFETKLISVIPEDINKSPIEMLKNRKVEIHVKVENKDRGDVYLWDMETFMDRLLVIRECVHNYFDTNIVPSMEGKDDPFWDPPQPQLIGQGYYKLEPLAYLIDNPHTVSLIGSDQKGLVGKMEVNILPTDETGWDDPPEDLIPYQPEDLIDKRIDFAVIIERAIDLPANFWRDVYCEYSFYLDDQTYATPVIPGKHQSPVFDYRFHHNLMITESTIKYLKNNAICFKVFGSPDNEHRPYFEPDSGEGSTFQASEESKEIDTTAGEAPSEDFSLKDNFVNNISSENENENKSYEEKSKVKNYQEPEQEDVDLARADEEPHEELEPQAEEPEEDAPKRIEGNNANFDEMFIYGGQPNVDADGDDFGSRTYSQSVYQQPKALISDHEKAEYIASHPRDDHFIDSTSAGSGKKGKKGKKEKKGKKGKKDKDCVIF